MRRWLTARLGNQRGMALPTALILLVVLSGLTLAFATLGTTEPVLARNHAMGAQARAFAESGFERALWVMNTTSAPAFTAGVAATPYDGSQLLSVSANGGFTVRVTESGSDRLVTAVGWAPDNTGVMRAARKIEAALTKFNFSMTPPLCALCVTGTLQINGNTNIDARSNHCAGTTPLAGTMSTEGTTSDGAAHSVYGPGDNVANTGANDKVAMASSSNLPMLSLTDLAALKAAAKAAGTYYSGAKSFNSVCGPTDYPCTELPPAGGIVFVDTTTGNDLSSSPVTPIAEMGNVTMNGNLTWSGWIIAMGDVTITGTVSLTGAVYARNDFVFNGNGYIRGAVATANKVDTVASSVDSSSGGSSEIIYDCTAFMTGGGTVSTKWHFVAGSYRELSGQ